MAEDAVVLPGSDAPIPATKPWERQWTAEAPIEASIAAPAGKPWERFAAAGPKPWERKWAKPEAITAERPSPGMLDKIGQPVTDPKQAEAMAKAQGTGTLDYVKNIGAGMGERVLDLMGGFGDLLAATAPGPDSGIKYPYGSGDVQADLQKASQEMHDTSLGYKPGTTWDDVKKSPASNFIAFAVEQGLVSAPDMAAAVAALPAYIAARTGELADERAENNASQNATVDDLLATMPAAAASAMLDRIGARSMFGLSEAAVQGIKQVPKEVAKSAVKEGATEAAQEGIEDVATTAGTKKGWQPADTAERMLAASLAGGFTGGVVRTGTGTLEAATHTDTPVTGDKSETVETENPQLTAPVTRDDGEGVDSPPSASSSSIAPEERAILRRTSIPDEDIDAMSREEVETKVAEARAAGVKVNGAMVRSAEQYQMPAAAPVPENVPVPAERPAEQPVDAKAAAQKLLQDYQTRKAREQEQDAQAEQAVQSVSPALSAAVMREAYEGGERAPLPRPDVPAEARPDPKAVVARQIAEYRARSANLDQTLANVQPDLESAVRANLAENREEDARVDQALGAPLAVQVQRSLYEDTKGDGSRLAPKRVELPEHVDVAAQRVNTEPSEAQKEAGNYQKGHIKVGGLDITIENPKGSTRSGTSSSGQQWSVDMPAHYGYVKRSTGADGDHVDVYVGDNPASKRVYVVDQRDPATRRFDEHKAIMGVGSVSDARALYARAFSDRSGADRIGAITPMSISEFKAWLREGDTTKPLRMGKGVRLNQDGFPVDLKGAVKKPDSLIEFLARKGGVREDRGELTTLGLRDRKTGFVVGAGPLIRPKGMHPDKAREAAAEAGYLPMESSLADFYDALDADARSGRQQFSQYDDDWAMAWRDGQGLEQQSADEDSARSTEQEVHDQLSAYGFPVEKSERFVSAVAREMETGLPFEEAVESAFIELAHEARDMVPPETPDIPFFGDDLEVQPGTASEGVSPVREAGEQVARAAEERVEGTGEDRPVRGEGRPETESDGSREDGGRSDRESPAERPPRVAEETGADNRPQLVIPGAERAPDADIAQRRADAPLKPKAPQKDPGGLFSDEMDQADLLDFSVNPITQSDAFKEWFAGSKVVDEEGKPLVVYHGAKRSDRINESGKFDRKRATSGPMAFFTDDPEIASNYATSKEDTSLDDETHLAQRFQVKPKGARSTRPVDQVWYGLDYAERQKIASLAPRVTVDDDNNIILEEEGHDTGIGNYDYEIKQARGNHLAALAESWLHSGQLFNEEERFLEVLNLAGMTTPVTYVDPNASNPGVFPVHLAIRKPLDTDAIPAELIAALEKASRRQRAPQFDRGKDQWDKSVQNPRTWIERLNEDQRAGTTHAWTSIPDWVTDVLKNFGYDGIKDTGGKNGGNKHNVWIPFYETQVKSPFNRGTFDPTNPKISYSASPEGWDTADAGDPMPKLSEAEQKRLVEIVSRTAGIDPAFVDNIKIPAGTKALEAWGDASHASTAAGYYANMRDIITLALDTAPVRAEKVAYHESFHRLQNLFLTEKEHRLLRAEASRLRKMIADKGEYSEKTANAMNQKEVEAEAFGIWAASNGNAGVHIGLRKVWRNIRDLLARIRNYLRGRGYQTVDDVFGKAKVGEIAKREKHAPKSKDASYSINERATPEAPAKPKTSVPTAPRPKTRFADRLAAVSKAMAAKVKSKSGRFDRLTDDDGELFGDLATRKVLDYLDPVLKMQQKAGVDLNDLSDAYLTARLAEGTIRHELHQVDEKYVQPAIKELAAVGATEKDLHEYMYAMHVPERNREVGLRNEEGSDLYRAATDPSIRGASGMSSNEAKDMLRALAKDRQKFMGIRRAASHIRAMLDDGLKRQLKAGLINRNTYDRLSQQWQHYVPLRAESDQDGVGGGMPSKSRGFDVRGDEFKGATGRYTKADNVVTYAVNNAEQSIIRAEKNKAATAALRFINQFDPEGESIAKVYWSEDPDKLGDITKAPPVYRRKLDKDGKVTSVKVNAFQMKDDVLAAKIGGKTYYMQFADPKVGLALKKMTFGELGVAMKMIRTVSGWQSLINTRANPAFVPINMLRDIQTGATLAMDKEFKAGEIARMVGSIPSAWGALWRDARGKPGNGKWDRIVADFKANGGKISFDQYNTIEQTAKKIQKDLHRAGSRGVAGKTWRGFIDLVENLNDTIENGMRVAVFNAAIERGQTPKRAAFLARDLTVDFQKKGEITPHMNALYTFFNASVQGNYNFARALYRSRKIKVAMGALIMAGYAQHIINSALAGDDDDGENAYLKMLRNEPWTFERNIVLFLPGSKDYIKLPLGFGMNAFWHLGTQAGAVTTGDKGFLDATLDSTRVAFDAFNPLGSGGWVSMFLPSVIDPVWELGTNQNFAGNPIYPQENQYDPAPPPKSEQAFSSTHPSFRWGAETLNKISGGSDKLPGAVDVYPDSLEYLWGWFTGGVGRFASQTIESAQRGVDLDFEPKKTPFIRSFYGQVDDAGKRSEYFAQREKVQYVKGKIKEFKEAGDQEGLKDFMADHEQERKAIAAFDASEKMRRKINKQRRSLEKHDGTADRLKALDDHELEAMDRARKAFFEAGKKEP